MPIKEAKKIWMNGKIVDWKDAKIHILTHAFHYGSGVFEGIRCYKTKNGSLVFRLNDHLKRLKNSAEIYQMKILYSLEELSNAIKKLIVINGLKECYIRPIIYRGYGSLSMNPLEVPIEVAIIVFKLPHFLGSKSLENGIRVKISPYQRISPLALPLNAKATGNYTNSVIAKLDAINSGYDDAIMLDYRGFVSEGTSANIFLVKNDRIFTPPLHASVLPGIRRESIIKISKDLGYDVEEKDIKENFLYESDEVFFTGTASEITPIREINGKIIGSPGKITKKLQKKFFDVIEGNDNRYEKWLDYV